MYSVYRVFMVMHLNSEKYWGEALGHRIGASGVRMDGELVESSHGPTVESGNVARG